MTAKINLNEKLMKTLIKFCFDVLFFIVHFRT